MRYEIKQPSLTNEQRDIVNDKNCKSYPEFYENYLDLTYNPTQELITNNASFYETKAYIVAENLNEVFHKGNVLDPNDIEHVDSGMRSLSIGDIIIDENKISNVVRKLGFLEITI